MKERKKSPLSNPSPPRRAVDQRLRRATSSSAAAAVSSAMSSGGNQERTCCGSLFTFIVTGGFVVLIYWAIFQPHHIRATVASADLTNLTVAGAAVSYKLAVRLNLYNPSLRVNIYYDELDSELRFRGERLGHATGATPAEFYQRRKSSDDVTFEFAGTGVAVAGDAAGELGKEKGKGSVSLEVAVDGKVRYRFGSIKIRQKPRIWCSLTIPVTADGGGRLDSGDRCSVKY